MFDLAPQASLPLISPPRFELDPLSGLGVDPTKSPVGSQVGGASPLDAATALAGASGASREDDNLLLSLMGLGVPYIGQHDTSSAGLSAAEAMGGASRSALTNSDSIFDGVCGRHVRM